MLFLASLSAILLATSAALPKLKIERPDRKADAKIAYAQAAQTAAARFIHPTQAL